MCFILQLTILPGGRGVKGRWDRAGAPHHEAKAVRRPKGERDRPRGRRSPDSRPGMGRPLLRSVEKPDFAFTRTPSRVFNATEKHTALGGLPAGRKEGGEPLAPSGEARPGPGDGQAGEGRVDLQHESPQASQGLAWIGGRRETADSSRGCRRWPARPGPGHRRCRGCGSRRCLAPRSGRCAPLPPALRRGAGGLRRRRRAPQQIATLAGENQAHSHGAAEDRARNLRVGGMRAQRSGSGDPEQDQVGQGFIRVRCRCMASSFPPPHRETSGGEGATTESARNSGPQASEASRSSPARPAPPRPR